MTYYKVLNADGTPCHGGSGEWSLLYDGDAYAAKVMADLERREDE